MTQGPSGRRLTKSAELLVVANSDITNEFYPSAISRAYYAAFHAAICYLASCTSGRPGDGGRWSHGHVMRQFRASTRATADAELGRFLRRLYGARTAVDYKMREVTEVEARQAVGWAEKIYAFSAAGVAGVTGSAGP